MENFFLPTANLRGYSFREIKDINMTKSSIDGNRLLITIVTEKKIIKIDAKSFKGTFDLNVGKLACIGNKDHTVDLCIKDGMCFTIGELYLDDTSRASKEKVYEDCVRFGNEICKRWLS